MGDPATETNAFDHIAQNDKKTEKGEGDTHGEVILGGGVTHGGGLISPWRWRSGGVLLWEGVMFEHLCPRWWIL
ncbi:hypothetical protein N9L68_04930 [bacterium]|nr:hypothetical protein [bacterium]